MIHEYQAVFYTEKQTLIETESMDLASWVGYDDSSIIVQVLEKYTLTWGSLKYI